MAQLNMQINVGKSKIIIMFNTGRKCEGMPKFTLSGTEDQYVEVVEQFKLLGATSKS